MKFYILIYLFLFFISFSIFSEDTVQQGNTSLMNDHYNFIAINEILMWVSNNGDGSHDPNTDGSGFYWPGGANATTAAIFQDGLNWGGIVDSIRVNGNTHRQGLQAGKILPGGRADDPGLAKYRVYKILNGWENLPPGPVRDQYELDFNEWPVDDGAPWIDINNDGIFTVGIDSPQYVGDETMWYVSNDLDTARSLFTYGSLPIGLEFQTTVWGYNRTNFLADVLFKKYRIINKSQNTIDSMYLAYYADDDMGDSGDDFVGCDSLLSLGYTWNSDNIDGNPPVGYGTPPPSIGHMIVQGPIVPSLVSDSAKFGGNWIMGYKNLPMTFFGPNFKNSPQYPHDPTQGQYAGSIQFYNLMQGLNNNGDPIINPHTGKTARFPLSGDPETGIGWYEGDGWAGGPAAGDRRNMIITGPLTITPGDTQEIVISIFMAIGSDHKNSVTELKNKAVEIHHFYGNDYITKVQNRFTKLPSEFKLEQNYPNPFNPQTSIKYSLGSAGKVVLIVYDILGKKVTELVNETKKAGVYDIIFDGSKYASGLYFYRLQSGDFIQSRKMLLVR